MLGLFTELRGHQLLVVCWTKFTARRCRVEPVGGGAHYAHVNGPFHRIQARDLRRVGIRDDGDSISFYSENRRARTTQSSCPIYLPRVRVPIDGYYDRCVAARELRELRLPPLDGAPYWDGLCGKRMASFEDRL